VADNAAREHARAANGDPDATAQAAVSSVWRNAIESALARGDAGAAGTLHRRAIDVLGPADAAIVANQRKAAQENLTGQTYTAELPLPVPNPTEPLDAEQVLVAIDAAHQVATLQNAAEFAGNPSQQATNKHFIDVRFGAAKRDVVRDKADLDKQVADWLAQPGQTERPPLAVWVRLSGRERRGIDETLAKNAMDPGVGEPPVSSQVASTSPKVPPPFDIYENLPKYPFEPNVLVPWELQKPRIYIPLRTSSSSASAKRRRSADADWSSRGRHRLERSTGFNRW